MKGSILVLNFNRITLTKAINLSFSVGKYGNFYKIN